MKRGKKSTWTKTDMRLLKKYIKLNRQIRMIRKTLRKNHSQAGISTTLQRVGTK